MIITYERGQADKNIDAVYFTAHRWTSNKDTLVLDLLWREIQDNSELEFRELFWFLNDVYKNRKCKSRCDIHADINFDVETRAKQRYIEIITKGVFPKIMIWEK